MSERSFEIHHTHRDVTGGWLRPAVFGASDGLVSNFALIAGVAGGAAAAGVDSTAVVIAGLAGLVAGACSMAAGEYVSVASQSEMALA
jgi:VIT1/CCC1 family predicted Fe2+/Mn2+ transporter